MDIQSLARFEILPELGVLVSHRVFGKAAIQEEQTALDERVPAVIREDFVAL